MSVHRNDQFGLPILAPHGVFHLHEMVSQLLSVVDEGHRSIALDLSWVDKMTPAQGLALEEACRLVVFRGTRVSLIGVSPVAFRAMEALRAPRQPLAIVA